MTNNSLRVIPELKIIADHLRSSCFLVADGISPSNEGRGYVLRRIMRRGMRQLHKLGAKEPTMHKLVDPLISEMGDAYPELGRARSVIIETLKNEEEKFRETLEKGLKILGEEIVATKSGQKFSGSIAFKLYDTYGFPLDLTQDILKEKNIEVDIAQFDSEMEQQRERARKNWAGSGEEKEDKLFFELKEKFGETKFLGYSATSATAKILAIINKPESHFIVLDQTPFYATSGGQVGDDGRIILATDEKKSLQVLTTKKAAGIFIHQLSAAADDFKIGDEVVAQVNDETRKNRASNHSATHLMHKALKEVLGNSISQKGSNVDATSFTFDFNFNRAMTAEEKQKVENLVNENIQKNAAVETKLMDLEAARNSGAEALFGEKYDAEVRVVSMANSVELCGGTHAKNTGDIEEFKITAEFSVASGIRRIEAITGRKAVDAWHKNEQKKLEAEAQAAAQKQKDKENEKLRLQQLMQSIADIASEKVGSVNFVSHNFDEVDAKELRELTNSIKSRPIFANNCVFAMFAFKEGKVSVIIVVSTDLQDKFDASKLIVAAVEAVGGKGGGGKKDMAMGGGVNKDAIPQAIGVVKNLVK
jgi:alanyl-tRNA synthetase